MQMQSEVTYHKNHARVDSKFLGGDKDDSNSFAVPANLQQSSNSNSSNSSNGAGGGLRRCAGTRDLTRIESNVNYSALVFVEFLIGDPTRANSWRTLISNSADLNGPSPRLPVLAHNLDTVRRFKTSLWAHLNHDDSTTSPTLPETTLYRKRRSGSATSSSLTPKSADGRDHLHGVSDDYEVVEGDHEALYMFALKDQDQIVLLVHENGETSHEDPQKQHQGSLSWLNLGHTSRCSHWREQDAAIEEWVERMRSEMGERPLSPPLE